MSVQQIELFCDNDDTAEHYLQDQYDNIWVEVKDGATHIVAVAELPKLIEQAKSIFELTIKTIPYNDKDCLVTFKKIGRGVSDDE